MADHDPAFHFWISESPIDPWTLQREQAHPGAGALAAFEGRVRDNHRGRSVRALDYQAYVELAEREGLRIIEEARARFDLLGCVCVHRTGHLAVGDPAVWVGALSGHRDGAFAACRWVIDEVKSRVPIWKREHYVDGPSDWIHPED
ncbi:MAG: molybdenum cofactor biosynthesis protein MoaE [Lysobacteraceae bacterium]